MHVKIYSTYARGEWEGEVPTMDLEGIFRFFNRVDEDDTYRLAGVGYHMPSLSVGDTVTVEGFSFVCAPTGWERVPESVSS